MRHYRIAIAVLVGAIALAGPVQAGQADTVDAAFAAAARTFERAASDLGDVTMGVSSAEYGEALGQRRFVSSRWGVALAVKATIAESGGGLCAGFAAYVTPAIEQRAMILTICPQFFSPDADALRETTILHELVHVVAGPDECRAMAYVARVQTLATGTYLSPRAYWDKNNCDGSRYSLPD